MHPKYQANGPPLNGPARPVRWAPWNAPAIHPPPAFSQQRGNQARQPKTFKSQAGLERRQRSGEQRAWTPRLLQRLHSPAAGLVGLHLDRRIGGHLQPPSRLLRTGGALSLLLRKSRWRTFWTASVWHRARVIGTTTRPSSASAPCHSTTSIRWPQCKSVPPRSLSLATRPGHPQGCAPLLLGDGHLWPPAPLLTAVSGFSVRVLCCALCHVQGGFTGESKFAFVPLEGDPMTAVKRSASNDDLQALAQVPRGPHPPELCCLTVPARAHSFCQILSLVLCGRARLY